MNFEAIKDLIFRLADDDLIIGHRNSEWTGLGPTLEEDIAFSSMAQDEIGHAQAYYMILTNLIEGKTADHLAFHRKTDEFRSCQLVEYPNEDYAFSLVRHYLYDSAESIRLEALTKSSFAPLAELATKLYREEKYHLLHAYTWITQLGASTQEANLRLQTALNKAFPVALSIFEPTEFNDILAKDGVQPSEQELEKKWLADVEKVMAIAKLQVPDVPDKTLFYGGRKGQHSEHLAPLLEEMNEVVNIDPVAVW